MSNEYIKPSYVEIIDILDSAWNCERCIFFKPDKCECDSTKRFLYGQALRDDCDDCRRPFILKSTIL
jgi:hypothetical protein